MLTFFFYTLLNFPHIYPFLTFPTEISVPCRFLKFHENQADFSKLVSQLISSYVSLVLIPLHSNISPHYLVQMQPHASCFPVLPFHSSNTEHTAAPGKHGRLVLPVLPYCAVEPARATQLQMGTASSATTLPMRMPKAELSLATSIYTAHNTQLLLCLLPASLVGRAFRARTRVSFLMFTLSGIEQTGCNV